MKVFEFVLFTLVLHTLEARFDLVDDSDDLGTIIGMNIGSSYSTVGVYRNGKVEIIPDEKGRKLIPSYVAFGENGEVLVGEDAKSQLLTHSQNRIYDFNRLIGRHYDDKTFQENKKSWTFEAVDKENIPTIEVIIDLKTVHYTPAEVLYHLIHHLKTNAESYLGYKVKNIIYTTPNHFNWNQRFFLRFAAKLADLDVVRWITEPIAAAQAYGIDKKEGDRNILVYNLEDRTFDATILNLESEVFGVIANREENFEGKTDVEKTLVLVEDALNDVFLNKTDIHDIILIGQTAKSPEIRKIIEDFFGGKEIVQGVDPDFAVVSGAVLKSGQIGAEESVMYQKFVHRVDDHLSGMETNQQEHDDL